MGQSSEVDELSRLLDAISRLGESRDAEVVLLRGHLAVERALVEAVAARLQVPVAKLPVLSFPALARLSTTDAAEQQELMRFNELRNLIAHELDALSSGGFGTVVGHFAVPWPPGALERGVTLELIAKKLFYAALAARLRWELSSGAEGLPQHKFEQEAKRILRRMAAAEKPDAKLASGLQQFVDEMMARRKDIQLLRRGVRTELKRLEKVIQAERRKVQNDFELIHSENWDELISKLRPRRPLTSVD